MREGREDDIEHPLQPLYLDENGTVRFKANHLIRHLYNHARTLGYGLHELADIPFSNEDREQFAQLLGYALGNFSELPYVSTAVLARAAAQKVEGA